jgi:hypothetical protein
VSARAGSRRGPIAIGIALAASAAMGEARTARAQAAADPGPSPVWLDAADAGPLPVGFGADELQLDAHSQALDAVGHVRVDEPPFHLTSDALKLRRVSIGVLLEGQGTVAFCPCLGAPLAVRFSGATLAPPHDLILKDPVLEVFGVPVAWAPVFWLRSPGRLGLLPPDVAWRGADGFFAGGGVHVPWSRGDLVRGLDLRAGGYVDGGVQVESSLRSTATETRVRWDRLRGDDGFAVAAHGATAIANGDRADSVAWDVDALRGARAVGATTDVEAAARPFDRATAQAAWRPDGWTLAAGVRTVALRGSPVLDAGVGGPVVALRRADALGTAGTYEATFEGGQVMGGGLGATSFARAEGGTLLATRLGALGASLAVRGLGDVADDGARSGVDGVAQARASMTLPLVREFASADPNDPWTHRTEPRLEAAVLAAHTGDVLVVPPGRGLPDAFGAGLAWVAAAGWSNAVGRAGSRQAVELDAVAGAVGDASGVRPLLRGTASAGGPWVGVRAEVARVVPVGSLDATAQVGGAFVGTVRLGPASWLHVTAHVAERDGVDPVVARVLLDAPLEPGSGFLSGAGWTGGARLGLPLGSRVTTRGGADVDLGARELVAAVASLELHDPCGCVVVRATAAHRIGRDGVDAWIAVDLPIPSGSTR